MDRPSDHDAKRLVRLVAAEQLNWIRQGDEYETAVLSGDPDKGGSSYVIRYRILANCDVAPHWHPEDEHVTVIAGEISLGFGVRFLAEALCRLQASSYVLIPRGQAHFTRYQRGTIVQVHGIGPLTINYLAEETNA